MTGMLVPFSLSSTTDPPSSSCCTERKNIGCHIYYIYNRHMWAISITLSFCGAWLSTLASLCLQTSFCVICRGILSCLSYMLAHLNDTTASYHKGHVLALKLILRFFIQNILKIPFKKKTQKRKDREETLRRFIALSDSAEKHPLTSSI